MAQDRALVGEPYVDVDDWRDEPLRHRYLHGGFEGTHTRFSFYFPDPDRYRGRFFQYLEGGSGGHETMLPTQPWVFRLVFGELGGFLVESNQGHFPNEGTGFANDWELFDASAESALFAKSLAAVMYGSEPHHGYVWGGSGGGARSISCIENRPDVYDGGAPHVIWSSPLGSSWSPIGLWWLQARDKLDEIVDATEPGGSGDPFAALDADQREALAALYRFGYPRGAERQLWAFSPWTWGFAGLKAEDPAYFEDFWTKPGHLGHDQPHRVERQLLNTTLRVAEVFTGSESMTDIAVLAETAGAARVHNVGIRVDGADDPNRLFGATATFLTGGAAGRSVIISQADGDGTVSTSGEHAPQLFDGVAVGDEVRFDNHDFVAWCYHFLYDLPLDQLMRVDDRGERRPLPGYEGLRAYALDDRPMWPQRPRRPAPAEGGSNRHTGAFPGKMIHVNATHDAQVWPNGVAAYAAKVHDAQGDQADEHYRLWWVQHAPHGAPQVLGPALTPHKDPGFWRTRMVDYDGVTAQALRDLVAWVEDDVDPPPTTGFRMTSDGGVELAATAKERSSVQPLAWATANGAEHRVEVRVGDPVRLVGIGEMAPGLGTIVAAEWDVTGTGRYERLPCDGTSERCVVEVTHAFEEAGTYFPSFRVGSHRDGPGGNPPYARNNARVRVVVAG
jgi:hypothetical protein